jgi:cytosine/adenosine deaminase-related metal-dependent hydrolase
VPGSDIKLIRGRWVLPDWDQPVLEDAAVVVEGGKVAGLLPWSAARAAHPEAPVVGSDHTAILPGLINAHHHAQGLSSVQMGLPDMLLEPWLLTWMAIRDGDRYLETVLSAARLLASGVTTAVDLWTGGGDADRFAATVRAARRGYGDAGLRVAFAPGFRSRAFLAWGEGEDERFIAGLPAGLRPAARALLPPPALAEDAYFDLMEDLVRETRGDPRVQLWYQAPGPQWVTDRFLQRIAERAAAHDTGLQSHVNESLYEKLHGRRAYGSDTMLHLERLGVLSPRFSIAHGVWLSEAEIAAMARTGAALAHNPGSNLRLHAGIAPVLAAEAAGVTVGLGMDATTLDDDEDMLAEMRLALRLHREPVLGRPSLAPRDALRLATEGGARLMRREGSLGRLAPGHAADIVVLDIRRACWPWVAPECDPLELILLRARKGDVDCVLVDGEVVYRDGRPTRFDLDAAARELAERMAAAVYPSDRVAAVRAILPHLEAWYRNWPVPPLSPYSVLNSRT